MHNRIHKFIIRGSQHCFLRHKYLYDSAKDTKKPILHIVLMEQLSASYLPNVLADEMSHFFPLVFIATSETSSVQASMQSRLRCL